MGTYGLGEDVAGVGVVEEENQKGDRAWDVNERVDAVDPCHDHRASHEESLNGELPEYTEALLKFNDLQSMMACRMYRSLNYKYCCDCAAELIDL